MPLNTFAYHPDWIGRVRTIDKVILRSTSVSGAVKQRVKRNKKKAFELRFENRDETEYNAALAFWDAQYGLLNFTFSDAAFGTPVSGTFRFISGITDNIDAYNDITYSFQIEEV